MPAKFQNRPKISVIITTYNRPDALELVLKALAAQDSKDSFEVIIADDGSSAATKKMLKKWQKKLPYHLRHVWQAHHGFRAALARNKAVAKAHGDYLIFLDGDSVPKSSFIRLHKKLASHGFFIVGNRVLLSQKFTEEVLKNSWPIYKWNRWQWLKAYQQKCCNRFLAFLYLPLGGLRKIRRKVWRGAKTCNLGVWRADFLRINGFDETFRGWGYEDSDLVIRLIRNGVYRKDGHFALPILHLWHPKHDRKNSKRNLSKLENRLRTN